MIFKSGTLWLNKNPGTKKDEKLVTNPGTLKDEVTSLQAAELCLAAPQVIDGRVGALGTRCTLCFPPPSIHSHQFGGARSWI